MTATEPTFLSAILAWLFSSTPHVLAALAFIIAGIWLSRVCERMVHRLRIAGSVLSRRCAGYLAPVCATWCWGYARWPQSASSASRRAAYWRFWPPRGLAVGFPLQATLSNVAAGIMLLWLRPFKVGDQIEVGAISGKVFEVGLFATEIHSADGVYQFVPNSELWNKRLSNYSRLPRRLVTVRVKLLDFDAIEHIRRWLADDLEKDPRVLAEPKPDVIVSELADDYITVTVQAWTVAEQYGAVLRDVPNKLPSIIQRSRQLN